MVHSGQLDRVIEIYPLLSQADELGVMQQSAGQKQKLRAKVDYTTGREHLAGAQIQADVEVIFTVYWMKGVTAQHVIEYEGTEFDIIPPLVEIGRRMFLQLPAKARHYRGIDTSA